MTPLVGKGLQRLLISAVVSGIAGGDRYPDLRKREVIWGAGVMVRF